MKARQLLGAGIFLLAGIRAADASAQTATCYNCPPEWADWGAQLKVIKEKIRHRGPARQQELRPVARRADRREGQPRCRRRLPRRPASRPRPRTPACSSHYKPQRWDDIPPTLKDPEGYWYTIHYGHARACSSTSRALRGKPVPQCWKDLLKPEYKGLVGYLDPASACGRAGAAVVADQPRARRQLREFRRRHRLLQAVARTSRSCRSRPRTRA